MTLYGFKDNSIHDDMDSKERKHELLALDPDAETLGRTPLPHERYEYGSGFIYNIELAKKALLIAVNDVKKRTKNAGVQLDGIVLSNGETVDSVLFDSDVEARVAYLDFRGELALNPDYTIPEWKASENTFVVMDSSVLAKLNTAGKELLTNLFIWQKERVYEINEADTEEAITDITTTYEP